MKRIVNLENMELQNDSSEDDIYYFAYGSNLNQNRMINRKAYFTERQCAKLINYEFKLHKELKNGTVAANIVKATNNDVTGGGEAACVYGALYRCKKEALVTLDKFEARGISYERETVEVEIQSTGQKVNAITYIALPKKINDDLHKVATDYLHHILEGRDILPKKYIDWIETTFSGWCVDAVCQK